MREYFQKYLTEFIGTFFLVFVVGATATFGADGVIAPVAIGFALMVMVYAGGHISGGHYNPAVSLAAVIRGALPLTQLLQYWAAQVLGGVAAAYTVLAFAPETVKSCVPYTYGQLFTGEFLFTFALCYVVLLTATSEASEGNSYYGLAIGSTVTVGAFAVGGVLCYGAFNPAVAAGLGLMNLGCWGYLGITVITNLLAAVVAGLVYKFVEND